MNNLAKDNQLLKKLSRLERFKKSVCYNFKPTYFRVSLLAIIIISFIIIFLKGELSNKFFPELQLLTILDIITVIVVAFLWGSRLHQKWIKQLPMIISTVCYETLEDKENDNKENPQKYKHIVKNIPLQHELDVRAYSQSLLKTENNGKYLDFSPTKIDFSNDIVRLPEGDNSYKVVRHFYATYILNEPEKAPVPACYFIVSRHTASPQWIKEKIPHKKFEEVITHLNEENKKLIRKGDTVIGNLPLEEIAHLCKKGVTFINLHLNLKEEHRGKELSLEEFLQADPELQQYNLESKEPPITQNQ
jgi:putative CRISPR-associated protein (TIGR02620 family)